MLRQWLSNSKISCRTSYRNMMVDVTNHLNCVEILSTEKPDEENPLENVLTH